MNGQAYRSWVAEGSILLAVVLGAWFFFIDGNQRTLGLLEATIAEAEATPDVVSITASLERFAEQTDDAREFVGAVQRRNTFAAGTSRLYDHINELAAGCNAVVYRLNPSMAAEGSKSESVSTTRLQLAIEAKYADAAQFIDKLQQFNAFVRPVSLRIKPVPDRDGFCTAEFDCAVMQFTLPSAVMAEATQGSSL